VSGLTPASEETPEASVVWGFLAGAEGAAMRELAEVSFADLCRRLGARLQLPAERDVALPGP